MRHWYSRKIGEIGIVVKQRNVSQLRAVSSGLFEKGSATLNKLDLVEIAVRDLSCSHQSLGNRLDKRCRSRRHSVCSKTDGVEAKAAGGARALVEELLK